MILCFYNSKPILLSLIAVQSVWLAPINLLLILHMKVMVTEVWSVSVIVIAPHLGGESIIPLY